MHDRVVTPKKTLSQKTLTEGSWVIYVSDLAVGSSRRSFRE